MRIRPGCHRPLRRPRRAILPLLVASGVAFCCASFFPGPFGGDPALGLCMAGTDAKSSAGHTASPSAPQKAKPSHSITVYVTPWCPACTMTIRYLKDKQIPFTVKDVEKNQDYMKEMVEKIGGYRGVPVLDIDGKTYLGFHPSIIDNLDKN